MEMNSTGLLKLLREVDRVRQESILAARLTGENFNVFNILGLSTAEVRTHSAFIAELLNPKGSHGQETLYLDLFLRCIPKDDTPFVFESNGATVEVEYSIGEVNIQNGTGGRIDILLSDNANRHIVIENKINAGDQEGQLWRYHNAFPSAYIYYLTLNGGKPDEKSIGKGSFKFICISYKDHISRWLEDCHKESAAFPIVRETIKQYKTLVDILTNQATGGKMKEKAIRLILDNPMLADAVDLLSDAWQTILEHVGACFWKEAARVKRRTQIAEGIFISYSMPNDCGGVVIAFRVHLEDLHSAAPEKYLYIRNVLQGIVSDIATGQAKKFNKGSTFWNLGWFNAKGFEADQLFLNNSKERLVDYYEKEGALVTSIDAIREEAELIMDKLLQVILVKHDGAAT